MRKGHSLLAANASKLEPINDTEWPDTIADLRDTFAGRMNVYRVMAHHPALLRAWSSLRAHVVQNSALTPEQREIVILRASVNLDADYEWRMHLLRGLDIGMSQSRIDALRGNPEDLPADDAVLCVAVDELVRETRLEDETVMALANLVDTEGVLDLMATVGFYTTLAMLLKTFNTPLDESALERLAELDQLSNRV